MSSSPILRANLCCLSIKVQNIAACLSKYISSMKSRNTWTTTKLKYREAIRGDKQVYKQEQFTYNKHVNILPFYNVCAMICKTSSIYYTLCANS